MSPPGFIFFRQMSRHETTCHFIYFRQMSEGNFATSTPRAIPHTHFTTHSNWMTGNFRLLAQRRRAPRYDRKAYPAQPPAIGALERRDNPGFPHYPSHNSCSHGGGMHRGTTARSTPHSLPLQVNMSEAAYRNHYCRRVWV